MSNAVVSAFKNKQLRKKLLFTTLILIVVRFGSQLPIPEIDSAQISAYLKSTLGDSFSLLNSFTGGSFMQMSVFALSVTPYITSSIIMQLMQGVIPAVGRWAREGDTGRRKITQVTRYLTLGLGLINAVGYLLLFKSPAYGVQFSTEVPEALTNIIIVFTLVAGTAFITVSYTHLTLPTT